MPYKTWKCSICDKQAPKKLREHGNFSERMKWLWEHRKKYHPTAHKRSVAKSLKSKGY